MKQIINRVEATFIILGLLFVLGLFEMNLSSSVRKNSHNSFSIDKYENSIQMEQ